MGYMSTGFPGLTAAQAELIAHWRESCQDGLLPGREQLDPGAIRAHLSAISLVEIAPDGASKFRLVGSELRRLFGRDMSGLPLTALEQEAFEAWSLGLARSYEEGHPIGGLVEHEQVSHAWLRLPLRPTEHGAQVLCHDTLIPNVRLRGQFDDECDRSAMSERTLAA